MEETLDERIGTRVRMATDEAAAAAGILVAFSDRRGGISEPPYDTLNLAARVGDDPACVEANRAQVAAAAGFPIERLALARQIHGTEVIEVSAGSGGVVGEADILVTSSPGVVLGILTADCAPVLLAGAESVAVVHAGWRGLVAGAIERGVAALGGVDAAWVGPSIHACCYEVGPEVVDAFGAAGLPVAGVDRVDPGRAAAFALHRAGVPKVWSSVDCTSCDRRYFSFRRDGVTGRQGGFIGIR